MSHLDLQPIAEQIALLEAAGKKLDDSASKLLEAGKLNSSQVKTLNEGMMQVERNWLNPEGIPGRPWFKHILYGARFTYAHLELPGLTEAVEKGDWTTARQQADILQRALATNSELIEQLNSEISK
jgi:N-acetylated-alpha-linked acidic dipeptidase